ncbi:MAG: M3 family metallopeptidase [Betaproteobacteria bacterium]|nr:MAG: M3 family metallopeptidase [Betaproteobacteria bacterium]
MSNNPLLYPWDTPFGLPPFTQVHAEHFKPAFTQALAEHRTELDAIAAQAAPPTFDNTLAAFDRSGRLLARIDALFHNLCASETSPALAPLAAHANAVYMHAALFKRIDALHGERQALGLAAEQLRLLERVHLDFVRAGAKLAPAAQQRYAQVMERLAELGTQFAQNVLADETEFRLVLRSEAELAGLPAFVRAAARQAAIERKIEGDDAHVITLSRSHIVPFLTFSTRRDLREQAWRAWVGRGERGGATDNRALVVETLALRREQAALHGYATFADYALADSMAGTQSAVQDLLQRVWQRARTAAERERAELQAFLKGNGEAADIEAWDWRFHAERLRKARYDLDEAQTKPYFPLQRVVAAAFDCAQRLFGVQFVLRGDIETYHPDVQVYEVRDADGALRGVFLHDNFARTSKRSGAWMNGFRWQSRNTGSAPGERVLPVIINNNNFAKGAPGVPTLLSFDDARTLFHEFGHGLHGLLSDVTFERLSGTNVLRDFVELPSQLFENWLGEREVLQRHARHFQTDEPIPEALIRKIEAARRFGQGYETARYTASALVDMAAHASAEPVTDITAFEQAVLQDIGLPPGVGINHRLPHFQHLFAGSGYAAGYYVYLWAEVLDADGFDAFKEAGDLFDAEVAQRLRRFIYSSGDSIEPGAAFKAFRGRAPVVEPMLRAKGLLEETLA